MTYTLADRAKAALALLELEEAEAAQRIDPVARLFSDRGPVFDANGVRKHTEWYEHSKIGEVPLALHDKQLEILQREEPHLWLFWGNQVGKTTVGAITMVLMALGRHPLQQKGLMSTAEPFQGWASALSWDLWEKILLPELLTWIPQDRIVFAPPAKRHSSNRDILIRADDGSISTITGKSAEQGASEYQSARVHMIWLDEEHPESIWEEMQPRLLRYGGRTIATMTPLLGLSWVHAQIYEPVKLGDPNVMGRHWYSHAGIADNPGIQPQFIENLRRELSHNPSKLASRLYGYFTRPEGVVYQFGLDTHGVDLDGVGADQPLRMFIDRAAMYGQVDFGKWRFAFAFGGVDPDGDLVMIDEVFSQDETYDERAVRIDKQLRMYGVKDILIYGDCAAPDDMRLLNEGFAKINAPWFCLPVEMKNKSRPHGISRVQSLIGRKALKMRRTMGQGVTWYVGKKSNSDGKPMHTSRWLWEMQNWSYPIMPDGKAQKDDPDDDTADGADMMDGLRYMVMQWLGPVPMEAPRKPQQGVHALIARDLERIRNTTEDSEYYGPSLTSQ